MAVLLQSRVGLATTCTTVHSGAWSTASVWISGIIPQSGDTAIISTGDSVWLDVSTAALSAISIQGTLSLETDTLFLQSGATTGDTIVTVQGKLDAGTGWFDIVGSNRPVVHLLTGSLFRTGAEFPYGSPSIFDSSGSPLFALDSASTWEYYSVNNALTDVSYLMNDIIGHAYRNLTLTGVVASYLANPLAVTGTLHIGFGASTKGGYMPQTVTLSGDVINDNTGPSGGPGAGRTGCGMLSLEQDTWIFDALHHAANIKDTIHWSGPSQLGTVIVKPNTVLSVRYVDDAYCDSLDILVDLIEEAPPCGGHLIGRAFSELPRLLDSLNPVDSFYGFGLTIASGTNPYLGLTRVVRTSGYLPPLAKSANEPLLRYYRVATSAGPQTGTPDELRMQIHCDELSGADPSLLHFWRSPDGGNTWAYSGLTSANDSTDMFVWDTTVLCWPNDSGSFLWMLSDGYTDTPLPVVLQNFSAQWSGNNVNLVWQTSSEENLLGFELDRESSGDTSLLATYWSDDSLRARSVSGATYRFTDVAPPAGTPRYDLYEITDDGARLWLASTAVTTADSAKQPALENVWYTPGSLTLAFNSTPVGSVEVVDGIGRILYSGSLGEISPNTAHIPIFLPVGFYIISFREGLGVESKKLVVTQ